MKLLILLPVSFLSLVLGFSTTDSKNDRLINSNSIFPSTTAAKIENNVDSRISTQLQSAAQDPIVVIPSLIFIASVIGTTLYIPENKEAMKKNNQIPGLFEDSEEVSVVPQAEPSPVVEEKAAPAPAPTPVATVPPPAPKPQEVAPAPSPPKSIAKDLSELRKEISSTVKPDMKKALGKSTPPLEVVQQLKKDVAEVEEIEEKVTEIVSEVEDAVENQLQPKRKGKRRFILRVIKKVIAPWRKWENIQ